MRPIGAASRKAVEQSRSRVIDHLTNIAIDHIRIRRGVIAGFHLSIGQRDVGGIGKHQSGRCNYGRDTDVRGLGHRTRQVRCHHTDHRRIVGTGDGDGYVLTGRCTKFVGDCGAKGLGDD